MCARKLKHHSGPTLCNHRVQMILKIELVGKVHMGRGRVVLMFAAYKGKRISESSCCCMPYKCRNVASIWARQAAYSLPKNRKESSPLRLSPIYPLQNWVYL